MQDKSYGVLKQQLLKTPLDRHLEEIAILGYTVVPAVFDEAELAQIRSRLDKVGQLQEAEFGREKLEKISELDNVRCPLVYDDYFLGVTLKPRILEIVAAILGKYFVLHLQNGVINAPKKEHHQSSWHRDLPYQDYVSSVPLAISALVCVDDFSEETGGTHFVPYSHKLAQMPSKEFVEKQQITAEAPAGSLIVFDSMMYHRAGFNSSDRIRRGINQMYTIPLLKQQIDLPTLLGSKHAADPFLKNFLGYDSRTPGSVGEFRKRRLEKFTPQ